jgi:ADP-heptose:LPS heptosyltransferase
MRILQLNRDVSLGPDMKLKKKTAYVMADPIAKNLAEKYKINVERFEMFEPFYKPYMGQNLDNKKIIIWRTGGYGDLLFITPIAAHLKIKYPTCKVSVATSMQFKDIWKNNPHIETKIHTLPIPLDFVLKHDYVCIFEGTIENFKSKMQYSAIDSFAFTLGIYDMPLELKRPRYFLKEMEINASKNKVNRYSGFNIMKDPYIVFQWKSSSKLRDYTYEKLILTMHKLQEKTGYKIIILTHPDYKQAIEQEIKFVEQNVIPGCTPLDYINLAGITSFRESAAVLALASGLVGIDSSLAHMAAAFGVPSVTLYGPFRAEWRTLYNKNNISIQKQDVCNSSPCAFHSPPGKQVDLPTELCTEKGEHPEYEGIKFCRAMDAISVDEIVEAYLKLLELQKNGNLPQKREFKCRL